MDQRRCIGGGRDGRVAAGAVIRFVLGITDALHWFTTDRTWLAELAMYGEIGTKRGDVAGTREAVVRRIYKELKGTLP